MSAHLTHAATRCHAMPRPRCRAARQRQQDLPVRMNVTSVILTSIPRHGPVECVSRVSVGLDARDLFSTHNRLLVCVHLVSVPYDTAISSVSPGLSHSQGAELLSVNAL